MRAGVWHDTAVISHYHPPVPYTGRWVTSLRPTAAAAPTTQTAHQPAAPPHHHQHARTRAAQIALKVHEQSRRDGGAVLFLHGRCRSNPRALSPCRWCIHLSLPPTCPLQGQACEGTPHPTLITTPLCRIRAGGWCFCVPPLLQLPLHTQLSSLRTTAHPQTHPLTHPHAHTHACSQLALIVHERPRRVDKIFTYHQHTLPLARAGACHGIVSCSPSPHPAPYAGRGAA